MDEGTDRARRCRSALSERRRRYRPGSVDMHRPGCLANPVNGPRNALRKGHVTNLSKYNLSKYLASILAGFLIWEVLALVLGNQPNAVFVRRIVIGETT